MHWTRRIVSSVGLVAVAAAAALSASPGAIAAVDGTAKVYVNDNTAGVNTVAGFNRHADGTLTPLAGSPFTVGGAGTGTTLGSQGALQLSADGNYLLAADAGSNEISVLRIHDDGRLSPTAGSPVFSGGIEPVSIAVHGNLVYVANLGNGTTGTNYTGFRMGPGGLLSPIPGSTFGLPANAGPGDILFNRTGFKLVGIEVSTSFIDSFVVAPSGHITLSSGSVFAQGPGPFGSEFSPTNPTRLYVSNAHGGANAGSISAFSDDRNGNLSSIGTSPFADGQTAPCWVEISHNGRYLFTVNTGSPSISSYKIAADGSLGLMGSTTFKTGSATKPFDARLNPTGNHLYVVDAGIGAVSAFAVNGGTLTELSASPFALPSGATPFGVVVI